MNAPAPDPATVTYIETERRLLVSFTTPFRDRHAALTEEFRAAFPRHFEAVYRHKIGRWSVPLHLRERLEAWITAHFAEDQVLRPRACRICGCTDDRACPGGCYWVAPDVCSRHRAA